MKKNALIILLLLFITSAIGQVKPKTTTKPLKPSKQVTINYITEKLNENCVGKCQEVGKSFYGPDPDIG